MKSIHFEIAGVNIRAVFNKTTHPSTSDSKKEIQKQITHKFKGFIHSKPKKEAEYFINFVEPKIDPHAILFYNPKKMYYLRAFKGLDEKSVEVYYSISVQQFQYVITHLLTTHLLKNKGFIIHSSAIANKKNCYMFLGLSGAGKSTIARLLGRKFQILGDDIGIIKKENGVYNYYHSHHTDRINIIKNSEGYFLKKAFIIKKSKSFKIEKIKDKNRILEKLALFNEVGRMLNFSTKKNNLQNKYIGHLLDFVASFDEFYYLYFAKNSKKLIELMSSAL